MTAFVSRSGSGLDRSGKDSRCAICGRTRRSAARARRKARGDLRTADFSVEVTVGTTAGESEDVDENLRRPKELASDATQDDCERSAAVDVGHTSLSDMSGIWTKQNTTR